MGFTPTDGRMIIGLNNMENFKNKIIVQEINLGVKVQIHHMTAVLRLIKANIDQMLKVAYT